MDYRLVFSRLTGRHVFGAGVFWSTFGFSFVAHALGSSDLGDEYLISRILAVGLGHLAMMTTLYATKMATSRLRPSGIALTFVFAGYVVAGAVRGLVLQYALYAMGVVDTGYSTYRLVGGVVVMTTGLVWAAIAFGLKAEWGTKRADLEATKRQLESLLEASETRLESEANDTLSTIESMLQTALIPELDVSPQSALSKLQSLINDSLRPLSASLVANHPRLSLKKLEPKAYRFRWRTLLTHLRLRESSRPLTLAVILSLLAENGFVRYIPNANPILLLIFACGILAVAFSISRFAIAPIVDRLPVSVRIPMVLVVLFGIGFGGGMAVLWTANNTIVALALSINGGLASALLGSLFGINHAATREMAGIESQVKGYEDQLIWTIARLNCQHWLQKKQFARKIHGPIQSEVAAAAIRIERNLSSGDVTESGERALKNLSDRLERILADTKGTADIRPVLAEIAETWHGLCQIEIELSPEVESALRTDPVCVETVLEIAREACSNAIRHGSAEHILLTLSRLSQDLVQISVRNDGNAVRAESRPGVGSAYLDDCTMQHELETTAEGAVLTATVPFAPK